MENLEYKVDQAGNVISIKTVEGGSYQISRQAVSDVPWVQYRVDRWQSLKRAVCTQPVGQWYVYGAFADDKDLKQAHGVVNRYHTDVFMKSMLNGHKVEVRTNKETLQLAVRVIKPDKE